jgi:hypothetical protein
MGIVRYVRSRSALALSCSLLALVACKGKAPASEEPAKAPIPAAGPLTYTTGDASIAGDYDGTKAFLSKSDGHPTLFVAKNCPAFSCANVSGSSFRSDTVKATCPQGAALSIEVEKDLVAGSKQPIKSAVCAHGDGSANGLVTSGADANEVEVLSAGDTVLAKVSLQGMEGLKGVVAAKTCPQ